MIPAVLVWTRLAATCLAVTCLAATGSAAEVEVTVHLLAADLAEEPTEITLVATSATAGAAAAGAGPVEYAIDAGTWAIDLPAGRWRLRARLPGYWSAAVEVDAAAPDRAVELRLWPAGFLRGSLTTAGGETLPQEVELTFEGDAYSRETGELPAATVTCPVLNAVWRCEVPAGRLNLILAAGHFVRHARWEVAVEPNEVRGLGTFELELGGAVSGRVELADGGAPSRECQVRLTSRGGRGEEAAVPAVAPVAEDGSFEILGLPARGYRASAAQPDYLDAIGVPVTVVAGESVELAEPLVLHLPAALELVFIPPVAPGGSGWRFAIHRLDAEGNPVTQGGRGESDATGIWIKEDLVPGPYEIRLAAMAGLRPAPRRIELPSGRTTMPIELPVLLVEGQVLAGGEPVVAKVTLSRPEDGARAGFDSDAEGLFSGLLPSEGLWQVRVDAASEGIRLTLDPIEVVAEGASGVAVVEIRLPDTAVEGEVTDLRGEPQVGATVRIQRRGAVQGSHSVRTDAAGRFRFRGLEPGPMSVVAQAGGLRSQYFEFVLYEGRSVTPLQLVVK